MLGGLSVSPFAPRKSASWGHKQIRASFRRSERRHWAAFGRLLLPFPAAARRSTSTLRCLRCLLFKFFLGTEGNEGNEEFKVGNPKHHHIPADVRHG